MNTDELLLPGRRATKDGISGETRPAVALFTKRDLRHSAGTRVDVACADETCRGWL